MVSIATRLMPWLLSDCCVFRFLFWTSWYTYAIFSPCPESTTRSRARLCWIRYTLQFLYHLQSFVHLLFFPSHWWSFSLGLTAIVILHLRIHSLLRIDFAILHNIIHMLHMTSLGENLFPYAFTGLWLWNISILKQSSWAFWSVFIDLCSIILRASLADYQSRDIIWNHRICIFRSLCLRAEKWY